ncbi:MAG TPA: GNAT family N-acetyltransferase [Bacteroidales bacterium]|jgi:ribosomal protein S18 acetylase RimI-like enzyme|nr:GNAT family N-acetyltransferase [Bacteroidales bacterium]HOS71411.1 GNAT family N-acetyltransferase [Bacteroidales bacterium]HQH23710.1 GNAT family N-acetyltransferase [Bacteroidales bacterium]HQJ82285.1 GNAT family N-acetyltransferase [Bacteroidales bacterium]
MKITEIKEYNEKVFRAVRTLLPQLDPAIILPSDDFLRGIIEGRDTFLFVAEDENGDIRGILTLVRYDIPTGTKFWIEDVVVDESQRGKGYGRGLMIHAIRFAESHGARKIDLTSRPERIAANRLYQDLGFIRRETNFYRYLPESVRKS